jgi:hypothetical protein
MKRVIITTGFVVTGLFMSLSANAALVDRGGGFIYDDVLDITWTQDANINGQTNWGVQVLWADSLSLFDSVRNVTWDDWRLPYISVATGAGYLPPSGAIDCSSASELDCRDNEYGYLFHQYGITTNTPGLFTDFQDVTPAFVYWSGQTSASPTQNPSSWGFNFDNGNNQAGLVPNNNLSAFAVRSGDVGVIPIPAAVWLFGSALGLLGWIRHKKA